MNVFKKSQDDDSLLFECPGCGMLHRISYGEGPGPRWAWNGSYEVPTIHPSILVQYSHWLPKYEPGAPIPDEQWRVNEICHSFITDGKIRFLPDCTHSHAGEEMTLPAWDE